MTSERVEDAIFQIQHLTTFEEQMNYLHSLRKNWRVINNEAHLRAIAHNLRLRQLEIFN